MFNGESVFVKDIRKLNLRPDVTTHALRLMEQIEYPVVFWVNAETDKNYAAQHPHNPNEFFVTIKANTSKEEMERIVLSNLYKAVQQRKRYLVAKPNIDYHESIKHDSIRVKLLDDLVGEINSFGTTLECELYLKVFGIETAEDVKKSKYDHCRNSLLEYEKLQKKYSGYHWLKENEASNLIEYAACSRLNDSYAISMKKGVLKLKPRQDALRYYSVLRTIEEMVADFRSSYTGTNGVDLVEGFHRRLVKVLQVDHMISLEYNNVYQSIRTINGEQKRIFTFIPDDYEDQELLLRGVRAANQCLGLYRESIYLNISKPYARITVCNNPGNNMSAYSSEDRKDYFILIYVDFLKNLQKAIEECAAEPELESIIRMREKDYVIDKLFTYAIFYSTLHEYGHIIDGDCDEEHEVDLEREKKATEFANQLLPRILGFQYRQIGYHEMMAYCIENQMLMNKAKEIIRRICGNEDEKTVPSSIHSINN